MTSQIKKPLAKGLVTTTDRPNFKGKTKQFIVRLALVGLMPFSLADWLIQCWGLSHE